MNLCCEHYKHFEWKRLHVVNNTYKIVLVFNVWRIYIEQILAYDCTHCTLFFNTWINFKLINMRNILFYLFNNHKNIRTYEIKNMRTRIIIPYRTILITGLSIVRKINIFYYDYVKYVKCIYFMPDTRFLLLCTFFSNAWFFNFLFIKYICV